MSVVGFDFDNESCIVVVARQRGIVVVLNDESKRETPAIVYFGDKQRFIGTAGAASTMMNPKNIVPGIKVYKIPRLMIVHKNYVCVILVMLHILLGSQWVLWYARVKRTSQDV